MEANYFTILYWFCHTSTWIHHGCTHVPHPELPSHLLIWLFSFLKLSCMGPWRVLVINSLSAEPFANIFSHLVDFLFILLMAFFVVQKLLSLIRSHLFIFGFISFALGDRSEKIFLPFMSVFCLFLLSFFFFDCHV